ncbi:hypothetical protein QN277_009653 [Acacia crassicarpa]|uniref:F-box domain-containing protein n=1 Tax=Acacia crassicarpa TaxID=499986 RepID=A0AAE1IRM1_9FABA|nr:hypothetical protein QN277_009653 [Acacia crassicarpa]
MKKATGGDNLYLPPEIIIDILKRLRVKSLLRFRAVCKDWRNLLKSPFFIEEHYHHSAHKSPLLTCHVSNHNPNYWPLCLFRLEKETVEAERIHLMDSLRRVSCIIGSSNGLLCVKHGDANVDPPPSLLLLNPATREVMQVPRSTIDVGSRCHFGFGGSHFGFGYSSVVGDYKIVRIHTKRNNSQIICVDRVEVYSLRTGSWKEVEFGVIQGACLLYNPVAVNGAIFWLGIILEGEHHRWMIISFDLAMEAFTLIRILSPPIFPLVNQYVLDVYENKLAMIHKCVDELKEVLEYTFIDLWVLEEGSGAYGKSCSWSRKYRIRADPPSLCPICLWRNEIVCFNRSDPDSLFSLTANNELKRFHTSLCKYMPECFFYAESLASMCNTYFE